MAHELPIRPPNDNATARWVALAVFVSFGIALVCAAIRIACVMAFVNFSAYREPVLIAHGIRDSTDINVWDMAKNSRIYLFVAPWPEPLPAVNDPKLTATEQLTILTRPIESGEVAVYRAKAEAGDVASASKLARIYYDGEGVPINFNEAFKWFQVAAEQGDAYSENKTGEIYRDGYIVKADDTQALDWFHKAASQGQPDAQVNIAWMTFYGEGMLKDEDAAAELVKRALPALQKSADAGDAECLGDLGDLYVYGLGVATDDAMAMKFYQRGADLGEACCQYSVGSMYEGGLGVPVNLATALLWYRKAAAQGLPDAQIAVAQLGKG